MPTWRRPKPRPAELRAVFTRSPGPSRGVEVVSLALGEWMPPCLVERPVGRRDWLIMAFSRGAAVATAEGRVRVPAGTVVVWPPGTPQCYGDADREWEHAWIHLDGADVGHLAKASDLPCGVPLFDQDLARFAQTLRDVHAELARPRPDALIVADLVHLLVRRIARDARDGDSRAAPPALLAVRRQIGERFAEPLGLAGLARAVGMSPTHLCAGFRRAFGVPPIEYLLQVRIAHARHLLADPSCPIAQAARAVGYRDVRTFARLVRRRLGTSLGGLRAPSTGGERGR